MSPHLLGLIVDTNSKGRFDLVIYDDGILALRGSYVGVAAMGGRAGAGLGGGFGDQLQLSRVRNLVENAQREELLARDSRNFFFSNAEVLTALLEKHWYGHAVTFVTATQTRHYRWKPALNRFDDVSDTLQNAFGNRLTIK
jgi:hypothetical protein